MRYSWARTATAETPDTDLRPSTIRSFGGCLYGWIVKAAPVTTFGSVARLASRPRSGGCSSDIDITSNRRQREGTYDSYTPTPDTCEPYSLDTTELGRVGVRYDS
jgi:hypothetical protein